MCGGAESRPSIYTVSTVLHSIAVSSDSKELYAGYSNQQIVGWVKPKSSSVPEEGEYEHLGMEIYYTTSHR